MVATLWHNTPMARTYPIDIPYEAIAEFCRRNHIRKLSLFGSVLRDDFTPRSDVDVLVAQLDAILGPEERNP